VPSPPQPPPAPFADKVTLPVTLIVAWSDGVPLSIKIEARPPWPDPPTVLPSDMSPP
jgi:hypothetical protein